MNKSQWISITRIPLIMVEKQLPPPLMLLTTGQYFSLGEVPPYPITHPLSDLPQTNRPTKTLCKPDELYLEVDFSAFLDPPPSIS